MAELHIHDAESIFITLFPKLLCSLKELEVIRFPNNIIEEILECITHLKFLRVLDLSDFEGKIVKIPVSAEGFIESLEDYNTFYR